MPVTKALKYGERLACHLADLHSARLAAFDLTPANVRALNGRNTTGGSNLLRPYVPVVRGGSTCCSTACAVFGLVHFHDVVSLSWPHPSAVSLLPCLGVQ